MLYFWDDPDCRMVGIDLVGEQILLQPSLIHLRAEEAENRPIVTTVPRSLDVDSLGRVAIAMLSFSIVLNPEWDDQPVEFPEVEHDESELPEFMGGSWVPGPVEPPSEENLARWEAEERRRSWPSELKRRLAGVSGQVDLVRNRLSCSLLQSRGQWQISPSVIDDATHPTSVGRYLEEESVLLPMGASEFALGTAIRMALERARNPWLPFVSILRSAREAETKKGLTSPPSLEADWIPSNLLFIHGETMDKNKFWDLIRTTRPQPYDCAQHRENLAGALSELDPKELAAFEKHYLDLKGDIYDVRVLEVMWILSGGGPGDEGWSLFGDWLILQGQKKFEQILKTPERLPELFPSGTDIYCGGIGIGSLAQSAYEETTGRDDFDAYYEELYGEYQSPTNPKGGATDPRTEDEEVLEERLREKYPDLWQYEGYFD